MRNELCSVLVVEDEPDILEPLVSWLEGLGVPAVAAANGSQALQLIERYDAPDLILLDLDMPVMSGPELLHTLRRNELYRAIPVVVLSSRAPEPELGVSRWLRKPYAPEDLRELISELVPDALDQ